MMSRSSRRARLRLLQLWSCVLLVGPGLLPGQETVFSLPASPALPQPEGDLECSGPEQVELVRDPADFLIPVYCDVARDPTGDAAPRLSADSLTIRFGDADDAGREGRLSVGGIDVLEPEERMWALQFASVARFVPRRLVEQPAAVLSAGQLPPVVVPAPGSVREQEAAGAAAGEGTASALASVLATGPISESTACMIGALIGVSWLVRRRNRRSLAPVMVRVAGGEW